MAESGQKDNWDKAKSAATTLSLIAVPLLATWVGKGIESSTKEAEIRLKTVEIAVGILESEPDAESEDASPLRAWAIDVIDNYSGIGITELAREQLLISPLPVGAEEHGFSTLMHMVVGETVVIRGRIELRLIEASDSSATVRVWDTLYSPDPLTLVLRSNAPVFVSGGLCELTYLPHPHDSESASISVICRSKPFVQ